MSYFKCHSQSNFVLFGALAESLASLGMPKHAATWLILNDKMTIQFWLLSTEIWVLAFAIKILNGSSSRCVRILILFRTYLFRWSFRRRSSAVQVSVEKIFLFFSFSDLVKTQRKLNRLNILVDNSKPIVWDSSVVFTVFLVYLQRCLTRMPL